MLLEVPTLLHDHYADGAATVPTKAHESDAAFDLRAYLTPDLGYPEGKGYLTPGDRWPVPTGVSIALPEGYAALVMPRSGLAVHHGITVLNAPGLIDSGYRGEIKAILVNHGHHDYVVHHGDRIAQLLIIKPERALFSPRPADLFDVDTDRGAAGIGSTGVR